MTTDSLPDTANTFFVAGQGDKLIVLGLRKLADGISHDEALNLAAWLVAMAYEAEADFDELLAAVKST